MKCDNCINNNLIDAEKLYNHQLHWLKRRREETFIMPCVVMRVDGYGKGLELGGKSFADWKRKYLDEDKHINK